MASVPAPASAARACPPRPARARFGSGRVVFWNGGGVWIGRAAGRAEAHAHHAIQLGFALDTPFLMRGDGGDWVPHAGAIVLPHARHQFDGAGQRVAIVFVEPATGPGRALLARHRGSVPTALDPAITAWVAASLRGVLDADADDAALALAARRAVDQLAGPLPPAGDVDPRIARVIDWLRPRLAAPVSLGDAAAAAHLSPDRFRHLFVAQTGTTFRAYLLWARLEAAVVAAMAGHSWTDAALRAGFADSAHLARTCRRMIGLAPGMLGRGGGTR